METTLSLVTDEQARPETPHIWREQPVSEDWLFRGRDEVGRSGWFLRLSITGLYPRRVGPFPSKAKALEVLEEIISEIEVGTLCELMNEMSAQRRRYVVEGIPTLTGQQGHK